MAALVVQSLAAVGVAVTPSFVAASAGGDTVTAGDRTFVVVKNGGGSSINVTLDTKPDTSPWGTTIPDQVVAVPAGQERWIGPLIGSAYGANASLSYSAVTSVTVGAFTN